MHLCLVLKKINVWKVSQTSYNYFKFPSLNSLKPIFLLYSAMSEMVCRPHLGVYNIFKVSFRKPSSVWVTFNYMVIDWSALLEEILSLKEHFSDFSKEEQVSSAKRNNVQQYSVQVSIHEFLYFMKKSFSWYIQFFIF